MSMSILVKWMADKANPCMFMGHIWVLQQTSYNVMQLFPDKANVGCWLQVAVRIRQTVRDIWVFTDVWADYLTSLWCPSNGHVHSTAPWWINRAIALLAITRANWSHRTEPGQSQSRAPQSWALEEGRGRCHPTTIRHNRTGQFSLLRGINVSALPFHQPLFVHLSEGSF